MLTCQRIKHRTKNVAKGQKWKEKQKRPKGIKITCNRKENKAGIRQKGTIKPNKSRKNVWDKNITGPKARYSRKKQSIFILIGPKPKIQKDKTGVHKCCTAMAAMTSAEKKPQRWKREDESQAWTTWKCDPGGRASEEEFIRVRYKFIQGRVLPAVQVRQKFLWDPGETRTHSGWET